MIGIRSVIGLSPHSLASIDLDGRNLQAPAVPETIEFSGPVPVKARGKGSDPLFMGLLGKGSRAGRRLLEGLRNAPFLDGFRHTVKATVNGMTMFLDTRDHGIGKPLLTAGAYEPEETAFVRSALSPGDVFVDVGANVGYFTCLAARIVGPEGLVFAFEPDPRNFRLLSRAIEANRFENVVLERVAIGDRSGSIRLYRSSLNHGDHRIYDSGGGRCAIKIRMTSLDEYFAGRRTAVDFLKMDIQGAEFLALRGMERLLEASRDRITILTEFWPSGLRRAGADPGAFLEFFESRGFFFQGLDGRARSAREILASCSGEEYANLVVTGLPQGSREPARSAES